MGKAFLNQKGICFLVRENLSTFCILKTKKDLEWQKRTFLQWFLNE